MHTERDKHTHTYSEKATHMQDYFPSFLFQRNLVPRGDGADEVDLQSKWGKQASSNAQGPRRIPLGLGRVLSLSLAAYGNVNPDSALATWKWTGHILKQMALIKICKVGGKEEMF